MKFFTFPDFNQQGSGQVPAGDFVACGIAASSDVDVCRVGSHMLGTRSLVQLRGGETIEAVRGFRTGELQAVDAATIRGALVLMCFERCDVPFCPGPRAPSIESKIVIGGTDDYNITRLTIRLPFSGRTQAVFTLNHEGGSPMTATVRGVKYASRELIKKIAIEADPVYSEVVEALTFPAGLDGKNVGAQFYIGGTGDNQEAFDELELWIQAADDSGDVYIEGEASGERG